MQIDLVGKAVRKFRLPTVDYINAPIVILPAQQGDVGTRYFEVSLYDDSGTIDLSGYSEAMLCGSRPDGKVVSTKECTISEDGLSVCVPFGGFFTDQVGRVVCDITFINEDRSASLTSKTFYVVVSESQSTKQLTENEEEYNELLSLLKAVEELEAEVEAAEEARTTAEAGRVKAEEGRVETEQQRVSAEDARVEAENARVSAETERAKAETTRKSNETKRTNAESARATAEDARVKAEAARVEAEKARVTAEDGRVKAEAARVSAETERETAESTRESNESDRTSQFNQSISDCDAATNRANNAADLVDEKLEMLSEASQVSIQDGDVITPVIQLLFVKKED